MDKSNYYKLQNDLLTGEIKSVKSQIELLQNKLHRLQEQRAWFVLVEAGRIPSDGSKTIESLYKEDRLKREEKLADWSKGVKGVPRKYRGKKKTDNKKSGPTIKRGNLEKWLEKRGEIK